MIGVKLEGRLGNQLFQYAFAISAAKKLRTRFYLDAGIQKFLLPKYFKLEPAPFQMLDQKLFSIAGFRNLFTIHLRSLFFKLVNQGFQFKQISLSAENEPAQELKKLENRSRYSGYYQSETYFKEYKKDIVDAFKLKQNWIDQFNDLKDSIIPPSTVYVAIHIRRGDYLQLEWDLPVAYYHEVIRRVHQDQNFYVLISDDPAFAEKEFNYLKNKYISKQTEIIDFQFLMHADVCILSNSSFSWWGAYLNVNAEKVIYAPQYFLGWKNKQEFPAGIYPSEWKQIKVN